MAEMELRGSDAMRSRVIKTIVAAAMLASLALGAGEAWGSDVTGPPPIVQSIRVPVMNYGEPDEAQEGIHGYGLSTHVLKSHAAGTWILRLHSNHLLACLPKQRPRMPSRLHCWAGSS